MLSFRVPKAVVVRLMSNKSVWWIFIENVLQVLNALPDTLNTMATSSFPAKEPAKPAPVYANGTTILSLGSSESITSESISMSRATLSA